VTAPSDARQVALVTGGGQGIGGAICERLAADGCHVVVNDLDESRAETIVAKIHQAGGSASSAIGDVASAESVERMFAEIEDDLGPVDLLVNNAGIGGNAAIRNVDNDFWHRVLGVDLNGVFYCSRRALGPMRDRKSGSIVNVSSRAWLGWWGQSAYATAKAGVVGMSRALAIEMASRNIRVNVVAPGIIDTPLLRDRDEEALARLLKSVPIGRTGQPSDVAGAVSFLISPRARAITGQVLYVCGGKSVYAYPDWPE
jgi:NAD(P)-dependent dehydrogenase (short-subunit alcohol dehydrogenase family)